MNTPVNSQIQNEVVTAKDSLFFYSRVKAQMEEQLQQIGYGSLFIFRPSFITGNRKENRAGESIVIRLFKLLNPLLIGPLRKYKSVSAHAIAKPCCARHKSKQAVHRFCFRMR